MGRPFPYRHLLPAIALVALAAGSAPDPVKESKKSPPDVKKVAESGTASTNTIAISTQPDRALNQEILDLLQSKYADPALLTSKKINQAAIQGVLTSLNQSAILLDSNSVARIETPRPAVNSITILQSTIGYLRCETIDQDAVKQMTVELTKLTKQPSSIKGLILDLRFSKGTAFAAVRNATSLFVGATSPLFQIQRVGGVESLEPAPSTWNTNLPLVVLINAETKEAAEVLAAVLEENARALVIGSSETAGRAFETSDLKLSNGQILRLATGKIRLPSGNDLFLKGLKPDVKVTMDMALEKQIFEKPFISPDFKPEEHQFSEAILTGKTTPPPLTREKEKKESEGPASNQDMVLLRAIDFLKTVENLDLTTTEKPFSGVFTSKKS